MPFPVCRCIIYCRLPEFTVPQPERYLAGGLQSGHTVNLTGAQYIKKEECTMIHFQAITEDNFDEIVHMKRPEGENFVASNAYSLAQAWLFREDGDVYPFAIYMTACPWDL